MDVKTCDVPSQIKPRRAKGSTCRVFFVFAIRRTLIQFSIAYFGEEPRHLQKESRLEWTLAFACTKRFLQATQEHIQES